MVFDDGLRTMIGVIGAMWPPLEVLIIGVTSLLGLDTDCGL